MNYKKESERLREAFKYEFDYAVELISRKFVRHTNYKEDLEKSEAIARICIGTALIKELKQIEVDACSMTTLEFYKIHGNSLPILEYSDFTATQIKEIIAEAPLSKRDKEIAFKMFVDRKNQSEIYDEMLDIKDKKTIQNNAPDISDILKKTASLLYKK